MSKSIRRLPIAPRRQDFDSEGAYLNAVEHWDELYNEAEDIAMEEYYEKRYGNERN